MSLTDVLEEVTKLSKAEKRQVIEVLLRDEQLAEDGESDETKTAKFLEHLLEQGTIKQIPPRENLPRDFEPVPIKGKPLSETIIEERR